MKVDLKQMQEKSRGFFQIVSQKWLQTRSLVQERSDQVAGQVAEKCTEWTGHEVSADQVKQAAATAGAVAMGVGIAATLGAAARQAAAGHGNSEANPSGGGGGDGWGNDFNSQVGRFFAENGSSLNIETHTIDQDGCWLD